MGLKYVAPSPGEERAEADREKAGAKNLEPKKANMHSSPVDSHLPATAPRAYHGCLSLSLANYNINFLEGLSTS